MDFLNRYPKLKQLLMLLAILAAAPFAGYLLLFIEVVGLEVAFACLLILVNPAWIWLQQQFELNRLTCRAIAKHFQRHLVNCPKVYFSHALCSTAVFALTGVLTCAVAVWLPVVLLRVQLV